MKQRAMALALTVAVMAGGSGCYGGFALTRKLHHGIGKLGNKAVVELAYLACVILPVYGVTGTVDFLILNTIEFFTDKNPVASATKSMTDGDKQVVMKLDRASGGAKLYVFEKGALAGSAVITHDADGKTVARTSDGRRLTAAADADGAVTVTDASGSTRTFPADGAVAGAN